MNYSAWLKKCKPLSFIALFVFCFTSLQAQNTISGKVTDAQTHETIIGATIKLKGSNSGTVTDTYGVFKIAANAGAVIQISSIGYQPLEVAVPADGTMSIQLQPSNKALNDVVVVGYGTQKKATLTGAVASVDAKVFQNRGPVSSPLAALQGQVPGVTVSRNSAQPGRENWSFQVRGQTSVNGTDALIIVDGVPLPNASALSSFNPNDIENISFLKDAAASIYGSRAAGGVVLITTKTAKNGKLQIDYNGSVSIKKVGLQPKLVDIDGWGPLIKEARTADGYGATDQWVDLADFSIYARQNGLNYVTKAQANTIVHDGITGFGKAFTDVKDFPFYPGTVQDYLWGNAVSSEHQLSLASSTDKNSLRLSLGYLNDGSLLQYGNNSNKRYNIRLTNDYKFTPDFNLQSNVSLERNDINQPTGINNVLNNGIQAGIPLTGITGLPYIWGSGISNTTTNSTAQLGGDNKELNTRVNANFILNYTFNKNLKAVGNVGTYFSNTDYRTRENLVNFYDITGTTLNATFSPSGTTRSSYQRASRKEEYYTTQAYLEYSNNWAGVHDLKMIGGAQYEYDEFDQFYAKTLDVLEGEPSSLANSFGDPTTKTEGENQNHYALSGYFSRLNYAYKNKYLFEADARYDGSSKFQANYRWKLFYGFSAGWRIQQEDFMKNVTFLDDLKLRGSYGRLGNQSGIANFDYVQTLNLNYSGGPTSSGFPIIGTSPVVRVAPAGLVAFDRTWETLETTNLGLDFAFFKSRLSGSIDIYQKRNLNMLLNRTYSAVLGTSAPKGNNGELVTKGFELSLNWRDKIGEFSYHIGGNIADSKNNLVDFGGQTLINYNTTDLGFNQTVQGYPINSYFGLQYGGRIQTQEQLDAYKKLAVGSNVIPTGTTRITGLQLGDNMYVDRNGDGKITFPEDAMFLGTDDPRYSFSVNLGFDWKGFDFSAILQGVAKRSIQRLGNWRLPAQKLFTAQNAAFVDKWWTPDRTDAYYPRISTTDAINNYNYYASDWETENGAYLRLKNVVLGYTIPTAIVQKAHLKKIRFYFSGNDLYEFTHIKDGWDPESTRTVATTGDANNNNVSTFSQRYPFYRFYTFGVNVTL